MKVLEVKSLEKKFPIYASFGKLFPPRSFVKAVDKVSFTLYEGETYGLVGESGSGKSTTGRTILGLEKADGGEVIYNGKDLLKLSENEFRELRKDLQLVFQDAASSLNPRKRVGQILGESLEIHKIGDETKQQEMVFNILDIVGLQPEHFFRFPHEFSGGQKQRLGLARALIMDPKVIILDEPVSALDVSIQAQILNLLHALQTKFNLTLLFITHDISVVRHVSNRIGIMYAGQIVEEALTDDLFSHARHPYTEALFSAVPHIGASRLGERVKLMGEISSAGGEITGCPFHPRCRRRMGICEKSVPEIKTYENEHKVRCFYVEKQSSL